MRKRLPMPTAPADMLTLYRAGRRAGRAGPDRRSLQIEEGDRFFVQRINVVGNTRTKDKVIRREVLIAPGDVFNTVRVDVSKKRLENLGYFSKVETYPDDTGVAGRKDLTSRWKRNGPVHSVSAAVSARLISWSVSRSSRKATSIC